jgi:hypothetical protein
MKIELIKESTFDSSMYSVRLNGKKLESSSTGSKSLAKKYVNFVKKYGTDVVPKVLDVFIFKDKNKKQKLEIIEMKTFSKVFYLVYLNFICVNKITTKWSAIKAFNFIKKNKKETVTYLLDSEIIKTGDSESLLELKKEVNIFGTFYYVCLEDKFMYVGGSLCKSDAKKCYDFIKVNQKPKLCEVVEKHTIKHKKIKNENPIN